MSFEKGLIRCPLPSTTRGVSTKIGVDSKKDRIIYSNGRSVFIRSLSDPADVVAYSQHVKDTTVARISPSGFYVASADVSGTVRVWDIAGTEQILKSEVKPIAGRINDLAWDSESKRIIAVGDGKERFGHAFLFDSGSSCGEVSGHNKAINSIAIRPKRPFRAVTGSDDRNVVLMNGVPYKFSKKISNHSNFVHSVAYSPSGDHFASAGADGKIYIYEGGEGDLVGTLEGHDGSIFSISWSADGKTLSSHSADRTCKLWDVASQKNTSTWSFSAAPSVPDQQVGGTYVTDDKIVSLSFSGDINVLDPRQADKPTSILQGHSKSITAMTKASSNEIVTGSYDGVVCKWQDSDCSQIGGGGHTNKVVGLSAAANTLYSAGMDDSIKEIDIKSSTFTNQSASTSSLPSAIAADGQGTVYVSSSKGVNVIANGSNKETIPHEDATCVAVTTSGSLIAVGSPTGKVSFYDPSSPSKATAVVERNRSTITALKFSPDSKYLAVGDGSGKIVVYDSSSKEIVTTAWAFHTGRVQAIDWTSDSKYACSGALDTNVYVWSIEKPSKNIAIKNVHAGGVSGVAWLDDNTLVSSGADSSVRNFKIKHH